MLTGLTHGEVSLAFGEVFRTNGEVFLTDVTGLKPSGDVLDIIHGFLENGDLLSVNGQR